MKIGFIGGGNMAEAILAALVKSRQCEAGEILVSEPREERGAWLAATYGIRTTVANSEVPRWSEVVFLAVKPQMLASIAAEVEALTGPSHLLISIAAGKRLGWLAAQFPRARVVRVMPNVAAFVGAGMNVFACGPGVTDAEKRQVEALLGSFGATLELPDSAFDAVTALSGSGPAFMAYMVQAMADAGVQLGLATEDALTMARQTLLGTARLLDEKGMSPDALIAAVSSPNGTTVAGMQVLRSSGVAEALSATLRAAAARSEELSH